MLFDIKWTMIRNNISTAKVDMRTVTIDPYLFLNKQSPVRTYLALDVWQIEYSYDNFLNGVKEVIGLDNDLAF